MKNFYEKSIINIKKFYEINPKGEKVNTEIFATLNEILQFTYGKLFYTNSDKASLVCDFGNPNQNKAKAKIELKINNYIFGYLEIYREQEFSQKELLVFETCSVIISNIIKEAELNSIIKRQLLTLQDGIMSKKHAYEKIVETEKLKNQFISNVSHELRSPLNSILGFTDLLGSQFIGSLNKKQLEYVEDIRIAGLHLLNMVNEILDMSKIESHSLKLNLSKFNIKQNIQEVLNILAPIYIRKQQTVVLNIKENFEICADYQKIQQILFNLLSNAIKFTQETGQITVSAERKHKYIFLSVKDNGCGIAKNFHKKIFNKFEQLKETPNSTGLGLTITSELVKMHKGSITVKSEENHGAEFIVKIPKL